MVVTHAYSVSNAGDGWLVHLAIELVRDAVADAEVVVVAVDGERIAGADRVLTFGGRARALRGALRNLAASLGLGRTVELDAIAEADLVVAVGGGYLRGRRLRELGVMQLVHGTQLRVASRRRRATVYLPQSVGPLPWPVSWQVRRQLGRVTAIHARDDRTVEFLASLPNVERTPDLAAMAVAGAHARPVVNVRGEAGHRPLVLFQVRPLPERPAWEPDVAAFCGSTYLALLPAVQSQAGRRNDDLALTSAVSGDASVPTVGDALSSTEGLAVGICGRLHAALACVAAGVPAIHIGYERKSLGVFSDLGLERYVVEPSLAGLRRAESLAAELVEDPSAYWASLAEGSEALRAARAGLVDELRRARSRP